MLGFEKMNVDELKKSSKNKSVKKYLLNRNVRELELHAQKLEIAHDSPKTHHKNKRTFNL